jgi:osmotically-inducible protein OsmY
VFDSNQRVISRSGDPDLLKPGRFAMLTDPQLQQMVTDELRWEPRLDAEHIGVTCARGVITLTGYVGSWTEKAMAEKAARRVRGVRAIAQEIQVRLPNDKKTADDEIAARAVDILNWDIHLSRDKIHVRVEHGIVTLSGEVDWQFQRQEAERDVMRLSGVTAVVNMLQIRPRPQVGNIKEGIKRSAEIEASNISVHIQDGKVTLNGHIKNWYEKNLIEKTVWSAPGVTEVDNRLVVQ